MIVACPINSSVTGFSFQIWKREENDARGLQFIKIRKRKLPKKAWLVHLVCRSQRFSTDEFQAVKGCVLMEEPCFSISEYLFYLISFA